MEINSDANFTEALPIDEAAEEFKEKDYKYEAFISYRHIEPDASIAAKIHTMIETFRVPKEFYVDGKRPTFRVFRDREELSAADLSASIDDALRHSKFLVVICSKALPLSEWCLREVDTFRKLHGDDRIIPVLVEGEPHESFPPALLKLTKQKTFEDGRIETVAHEILAAEMRPDEVRDPAFPGYAALRESAPERVKALTAESLKLLKVEKYRIMAAILGCSYGDLKQRDKERRTRTALALASVLALMLLGFGIFMFNAYQKENLARRAAVQSNSAMLLNTAKNLISEGDKLKALLVADQAMAEIEPSMEKFAALQAEHTTILNDAVYNASASLLTVIKTENNISFFAVSPDGSRLLAGLGNNQAAIFDAQTGALVRRLDGHTAQVKIVEWSPDGKYFVTSAFDDRALVWDASSYEVVHEVDLLGSPIMSQFSKDGSTLVTAGFNWNTYFFQFTQIGSWQEAHPPMELKAIIRAVGLSPDASQLLVTYRAFRDELSLELVDLETGKPIRKFTAPLSENYEGILEPDPFYNAKFSADGKTIVAYSSRKLLKLNPETGAQIFSVGEGLYLSDETTEVSMTETRDGSRIFLADGSKILAFDGKDGRLVGDYFVSSGVVTYLYHEDTDTLAALKQDGNIAIIRDGVLVESGLDYGTGIPDLIEVAPDGSKLYVSSRGNKEIKIVDLRSRNIETTIAGQIIQRSADNRRVLMYDGNDFFLWDNEKNQRSNEPVMSDEVDHPTSFAGYLDLALSPGGKKAASYYSASITDADGNPTGDFRRVIQLIDLPTDTEIEVKLDSIRENFAFSPDGKTLAALAYGNPLSFYDAESGALLEELNADLVKGYMNSIFYSLDSKFLVLNYQEGSASVIDREQAKEVVNLPGEILFMGEKDGEIEVRGLFNNASFFWTKSAGLSYTKFDPACDQAMVSLSDDQNIYHAPSDLILMIRKNAGKPIAFLVQFSTGNLLKTFTPSLTAYQPQGFISEDGKMVGMDEYYYSAAVDPNKTSYDDAYTNFMGTTLYKLYPYDELLAEGKKLTTGRSLTPAERLELGLQ